MDPLLSAIASFRDRALTLLGEAAPARAEPVSVRGAAETEARWAHLASTFALSPPEAELLRCLIAAEFDPEVRDFIRARQRDAARGWIEVTTAARLIGLDHAGVIELSSLLEPDALLVRHAIVELEGDEAAGQTPFAARRLKVSSRIVRYLLGDDRLAVPLHLREAPSDAPADRDDAPLVSPAVLDALLARARRALAAGQPLVIEIVGAPGTGRRTLAAWIARQLGTPRLVVLRAPIRGRSAGGARSPFLARAIADLRRESRLYGALACVTLDPLAGPPDTVAEEGAGGEPATHRAEPPAEVLDLVGENRGLLVVIGEQSEPLLHGRGCAVTTAEVPFPSPSLRAALLLRALSRGGATVGPDVDAGRVTRQFALDPERIERAAQAAIEAGLLRAPEAPAAIVSHADLVEACRRQLRQDLRSLATRVTANHRWEDLVIPVAVYHGLEEMISYLRHGHRVYEEWGFGARHSLAQGMSALFVGPPGTGKTMCASVMARELDMELFRVDPSRVVSRWAGETEKNLARVFDEAQRSNAILLFDEADALFARRTDVKSSVDRYANLEVNFLLQRMEAFGGVTILTTNFEDTIDSAFKRRLTFRLQFEKPDAGARAALWRKVFPSECRLDEDVDPVRLGELFEVSGGTIRNAAVRAAFFAARADRPVSMEDCLLAGERESQEMGLLTRSVREPSPPPPDHEPPPAEPPPSPGSSPRLVPITRPRR